MSAAVSVVVSDAEGAPRPLPGDEVVFLPITLDGDTPLYQDVVPELVTELRAGGVAARTWHPADESEFVSGRGPLTEALIQIAVGIASSGGWWALQSLLKRRGGKVHVIAVFEQDGRRRRAELTGEAADVAETLKRLDPFQSEPPE